MDSFAGPSGVDADRKNDLQQQFEIMNKSAQLAAQIQLNEFNRTANRTQQSQQEIIAMKDMAKGFKDVISSLKSTGDQVRQS